MSDTIFALATAKGRAGIAVIRLSGPLAFEIAENICGGALIPRRPMLRKLVSGSGVILDEALVLAFESGASFTGENVVEFQCHGSPAVIDALTKELSLHPARLAEPGEFTRRSLENGCLDLSQVEGLADLLEAETEAQRVQAFRVMRGSLSDKVENWRSDLIRAAALIEATIDFADEEVPVDVSPEVGALISKVKDDLQMEIDGSYVAERIRDGFEVAIVGPPNVGKSTLLNTLSGREAAITSEIAGTTRDVIEVRMDIKGLPVTFLDTAGLRETEDKIESLGIALAKKRAEQADLRVFLLENPQTDNLDLQPAAEDIVITGKADLGSGSNDDKISGLTGQGVDRLIARIADILGKRSILAQNAVRQRHRIAMGQSFDYLQSAEDLLPDYLEVSEIIAVELNRAIYCLNSLIGRVDIEDLLDEIFSSFCLGK